MPDIPETENQSVNYVQLTKDRIPDLTLRRYIYGTSDPKRRQLSSNLISAMNNIMITAFFALFAIWKEHREDTIRIEDGWGEEQRSAVHAKRINEVMENIYCNSILTQETISFVFTEVLLEIRKNYDSPFSGLIKGAVATSKFPKIAELIRVWKMSFQGAESHQDVLISLYVELLNSLDILQYMSFVEEDKKLICKVEMPGKKPFEGDISIFIKRLQADENSFPEYYYLYRTEGRANGVLLEYMEFNGRAMYRDELDTTGEFFISKRDFYERTCNNISLSKSNDISATLQIQDFKYIHRLALCISDALGVGTKRDLLERINEIDVYRDMFRGKDIDSVNWDNTVVLLMLEDGPSEIIETVLKSDINAFENILKSVMIRFLSNNENGEQITYKMLKNEYMERERAELAYQETMQSGISKNRKVRAWIKNAQIFLMSQFIISKVAETEVKNRAFYAENLTMKVQKINSAIEKNGAMATISLINKTLERVFRIIILFYNGVLAYGKAREDELKKYSLNERHSERVLAKIQQVSEDAFFDCIKTMLSAKYGEGNSKPIKTQTLGNLFDSFEELCKRMETIEGKRVAYNPDGSLLHSVIGRRKICNLSVFRKIISHSENDPEFKGVKNPPKDIRAFFNKVFKHDDPSTDASNPKVVNAFIGDIRELFEFLDVNEEYAQKHHTHRPIQTIFDPIFPYVVRYSERNENRDRCSVCQYIINTDGGFEDTKIKILTEYNYVMNELYYCIPNAESSTKNWWVNPLLISCRRFDELFLELEEMERREVNQ